MAAFKCSCGLRMRCMDSRLNVKGTVARRRYWCTCGYRVTTKETICEEGFAGGKITTPQAQEIRALYAQGRATYIKLGVLYGVSSKTIYNIVKNKIHKAHL